jgi:formate-dependent nitrite reductase membrane component NrfD
MMAEHFTQPPNWEWYIAGYFFCGGVAGGLYALATMLKLWGSPRDAGIVRAAFLTAFPLVVVCGILLTIDLGHPLRFWHMMINTTPGEGGLNFKYWSPMSLGTWVLLVFSILAFISFVLALGKRTAPAIIEIAGTLIAFVFMSYTGVLLSVSNQPVWSDTWALGGLFVASALSGSAVLLTLFARRMGGESSEPRLLRAEGYFGLLEVVLIAIFFVTVAQAGTLGKTFSGIWIVLWILVFASLIPALRGFIRGRRTAPASPLSAIIVLAGVLLMRCVVVFSAQS